ncbi:MAG: DUF116 domain-containing protein [Candidatus Aenigmatarchaeota archaeon]
MSYSFDFDLTKISKSFFKDVARFTESKDLHHRAGEAAKMLVKKTRIKEITGLPMEESIQLLEDMAEIHVKNLAEKDRFEETDRRALFVPHCVRKHMDNKCEAEFDQETSSYICKKCSENCSARAASELGEENNYDVYIVPGSSCIPKIMRKNNYGGVVGIACSEEIMLAIKKLEGKDISYQGVPLLKNGCSNTKFNRETLRETL